MLDIKIDRFTYFARTLELRGSIRDARRVAGISLLVAGADLAATITPDASGIEGARLSFALRSELPAEAPLLSDLKLSIRFENGDEEQIEQIGNADILSDRGHQLYGEFLARLRAMPSGSVLEVGSRARSGITRRSAIPQALKYVGLDIVEGENVDVVCDAHEMTKVFQPDTFDAVLSLSTFEHLAMPWKVALELNKVMKEGAIGFLHTHQSFPLHEEPWDFFRISHFAWRSLFNKRTGFEIIDVGAAEPVFFVAERWHPGVDYGEVRGMAVSTVIVKKKGSSSLIWDVSLSDLVDTSYPF